MVFSIFLINSNIVFCEFCTGSEKKNESKKNVVYQISCKDCDAIYVRQTGRKLKIRIAENRNHINRITPQSVITGHRLHHDYEFDWTNIKIFGTENI